MTTEAHRERIGSELRRLREAAAVSGPEVAAVLGSGWSQSKVSRIENAKIGVTVDDLGMLLRLYGAPEDVQAELLTMAAEELGLPGAWVVRAGGIPRRLTEMAAVESRLTKFRQFHALAIPGQLQSPSYIRAIAKAGRFGDPDAIAARRLARQDLLVGPGAPRYEVVLDARALLFRLGGRSLAHEQLEYLQARAELPAVDLRVIPMERVREVFALVPFIIYDFRAATSPSVVMIETQAADLYLSSTDDVQLYGHLHERLLAEALSPAESLRYLSDMTKTLDRGSSNP